MLSLSRKISIVVVLLSLQVTAAVEKNFIDTTANDSMYMHYPEKRVSRKKWEYVVSAPLWIATSPLYLSYKLLAESVEFLDNHHIPGKLERILVSEDGTRHIEPYYSSTTGLGICVRKEGVVAKGTSLNVAGSFGSLHRHGAETEWRSIPLPQDNLFLDAHVSYHYVPDEPFFGIGTNNKFADRANYSYKNVISFCSVRYQLLPSLNAYLAGTLDYYSIGKSEYNGAISLDKLYKPTELPVGFYSTSLMGGGVIGLDMDTRDKSGRTRKGVLIKAYAVINNEVNVGKFDTENRTSGFGFRQSSIDISHFTTLPWGNRCVVIVRAALNMIDEMKDKEIPAYHLSTLGGDQTIRGFSQGRFRDRDYALFSTEYRYPIWWDYPFCLDAAVFIDAGKVSYNIVKEFNRSNVHYGYGGGFRLYNDDELAAAVYFGFSKDDYRMELVLGEDSLTRLLNVIKKMADI